jgi:hypothetical protein
MEVYGATGYAITVDSNKLRFRHEHDEAEQLTSAAPLPPNFSDSLSYLAAVMDGQIVTREGPSGMPGSSANVAVYEGEGAPSALDTNVIVMQILDAARESARTGKTVRLTKLEE